MLFKVIYGLDIKFAAKLDKPFPDLFKRLFGSSRIAANSVVLSAIPEDCTAVGIPAKPVKISGKRVNYVHDVDQTSVTDPVAAELAALRKELEELKNR